MLQKLVINKVINLLAKNFKLFKLMEYVEKPNELDHKVAEHDIRIKSHSDRLIALEKKAKKIK